MTCRGYHTAERKRYRAAMPIVPKRIRDAAVREIEDEILSDGPIACSRDLAEGIARSSNRRAVREAWQRRVAGERTELHEVAILTAPPR
jgi:hypothetical protein